MSSSTRTLVAVALLAIVVALAFATVGMLVYLAALGDAQSHAHPANQPTVYRVRG